MIPQALAFKIGELLNFSREQIEIQPNGSTSVRSGQKIIIDLPYSTLVDLESLRLEFDGKTSGNADDTLINEKVFFPRNIASLIDQLEVKFNNITVQSINNYGLLYTKLCDLTQNQDACYKKNCLGENSDPSYRISTSATDNSITVQRGYAHAPANTLYEDRIDKRHFCIRGFLGILGQGSTTAVDTGLIGNVSIHITLNNGSCLMKSQFALDGATVATGTIANPTFELENVVCKMTRYQMNNKYYEALQSHLSSGMPYEIGFEDYEMFSGASSTSFNTSVRFTTASKSLKWAAATFVYSDRDTVAPVEISDSWANDTLNEKSTIVLANMFNNSRYFYTTGGGVDQSYWKVGSTQLPSTPAKSQDRFTASMEIFNQDNDALSGINHGIVSKGHFENGFWVDFLQLCYTRETDMYTMSGLDTLDLPLSITYHSTQKANYTDATNKMPIIFTCADKVIQIHAGQQIKVV
jgi:hypothetical protein